MIPKYRRCGIGTQAAKACFALHSGLWEVKPVYGSESAYRFWRQTIHQVAEDAAFENGVFTFVLT